MNNYKFEIDTHCHSTGSVHAFSTMNDIISLTVKNKMKGVCITDHHSSLATSNKEYRILAPDDAYFHVFCQRYSKSVNGIRIFKGIEMNILDHSPWIAPLKNNIKNIFDIKLAGIHSIPHLYKADKTKTENTDIVLKAINSIEEKFNILVHPCYSYLPIDIEVIVKECTKKNIALELNNSSIKYNKCNIKTVFKMLKNIIKYNGKIAVGTDAHCPNEIGVFDNAISILNKINFPEELIINLNTKIFEKFIQK